MNDRKTIVVTHTDKFNEIMHTNIDSSTYAYIEDEELFNKLDKIEYSSKSLKKFYEETGLTIRYELDDGNCYYMFNMYGGHAKEDDPNYECCLFPTGLYRENIEKQIQFDEDIIIYEQVDNVQELTGIKRIF